MRTGLALPYMLGIDVISFSISMSLFFLFKNFKKKKKKKKKKIEGEDAEFYFDSFSDIACVFA
jgi:hypothetical protein